jgi:Flp pilus assembly protein TadG
MAAMTATLCLPFAFARSTLSRLLRDRRGVAAIEFAMILPLMLTMFLGSIEVTQGITADRKIGLTVRAAADLTSQSTSISNAEMTNILNAATSIMYPFPTGPLRLKVTAVNINGSGQATVAWGDSLNTTKRSTGSSVSIPAALAVANTQLIWGEIEYDYNPTFGYVLFATITLSEQNFVRPRQSNTVARTP